MADRRVIKSVLPNFLGTSTSRYSGYGGYRSFGFLVSDLGESEFNLLYCDENGDFMSDTFHESVHEAMDSARDEFSVPPEDWQFA